MLNMFIGGVRIMNYAIKRINLRMPEELLYEVDTYARKINVNRTSALNMLVLTALEHKNMEHIVDGLILELRKGRMEA